MSHDHVRDEDETRLNQLGYTQQFKRIFKFSTNFGLTASMISILLGVIPLFNYQLATGGPVVLVWSWLIVGIFSIGMVSSLAEICGAYPTMGALYFWSYRLGGPTWGPFASWMSGWCNLVGQIAGVASGGYAGAEIIANIISLKYGSVDDDVHMLTANQTIGFYAVMLVVAGIVNTFAEQLLTPLCYISFVWQVTGTITIVAIMLVSAPELKSWSFVFSTNGYNNETGFESVSYVTMIGCLAAASVFTGYDTAAHVSEETTSSHTSTPLAMILAILNALVLGLLLIIGMCFCIQDIDSLVESQSAFAQLWLQVVGRDMTIFFHLITLVAIECSNCANLTSGARMIFAFARDGALPKFWYHIDPYTGGPTRAIWLCLFIAFVLGLPGLANTSALNALFSLTATGLYSSYIIPIFLRVTVSKSTFIPAEFNLGRWSIPLGYIAACWGVIMVVILCLPTEYPVSIENLNYSPLALGSIILYALVFWVVSAHKWFKGALRTMPQKVPLDQIDLAVSTSELSDLREGEIDVEFENVPPTAARNRMGFSTI